MSFWHIPAGMDEPMFLQQLINGIALGSTYALIALGYTMVYGIITLINFAHGEIFMVGAFIGLLLVSYFKVNIFVAIIGAMIFCMIMAPMMATKMFTLK